MIRDFDRVGVLRRLAFTLLFLSGCCASTGKASAAADSPNHQSACDLVSKTEIEAIVNVPMAKVIPHDFGTDENKATLTSCEWSTEGSALSRQSVHVKFRRASGPVPDAVDQVRDLIRKSDRAAEYTQPTVPGSEVTFAHVIPRTPMGPKADIDLFARNGAIYLTVSSNVGSTPDEVLQRALKVGEIALSHLK